MRDRKLEADTGTRKKHTVSLEDREVAEWSLASCHSLWDAASLGGHN